MVSSFRHPFLAATATLVVVALALMAVSSSAARVVPAYRCGVCLALVDDIESRIATVDREHPYEVQSRFRLDEKQTIRFARAEQSVYEHLDPSRVSSTWEHYGYVPSRAPVRVFKAGDPEHPPALTSLLVRDATARRAFQAVHEEILDRHEEALARVLSRSRSPEESKRRFCVDTCRACAEWPVVWGEVESTDAPVPAPAPAQGAVEAGEKKDEL